MKISKVEAFLLSYAFDEPLKMRFWGGERTIFKRDAMLIRVTADNGLKGYAPGPADMGAQREISGEIASFLDGRDPLKWREFGLDSLTYYPVEIALIDLAAKYEGAPMSELIGGRKRDRIKLYGSAGMYMSPTGYAEEAAAIQEMGFCAYKLRPAAGPEADLETVRQIREATGEGFGVMLDAHGWWRMGDRSYSPDMIEQLARDVSRYSPTWLEEPLPPEDHAAYRELRSKKILPLASGEHEPDEAGFLELIDSGCVDYVQADVCCQGGFEMGRRIFEACARADVRFAFHCWGTLLEVIVAAQLGVCWDEDVVEWLEYPCYANGGRAGMYANPPADEILKHPLEIDGSELVVPSEPGLGVEVDESVIEKYPFLPGPWSVFQIDSPPETLALSGDLSVAWSASDTR